MKKCSACNVEKEDSEFYKKGDRNKSALRADCKVCFKNKVKLYAADNKGKISDRNKIYYLENFNSLKIRNQNLRKDKKEIIENIKINPCCDCGKRFQSCAMDFDHKEPNDKKDGISKLLNAQYSIATLISELKKCDLVCANCHRHRTYNYFKNLFKKRKYPSREIKQAFINKLKENKTCVDCGNLFHPYQMDYDHVKGEKLFKISRAITARYSVEEITEEVQKCELVCVNCHRARTQKRLGKFDG